VYGRGDPGFQVAAAGGDWDRAFAPLVEVVRRAGVRRVDGDLVADESCFRGPAVGSGWEYDDLGYYYGAGVSALSLNDNAVDVVVRPGDAAGRPAVAFLFPSTRHLKVINRAVTGTRGARREIEVSRQPDGDEVIVSGLMPLGSGPVTESVSVPRPAAWFGEEFRGALARAGVVVRGPVRLQTVPDVADVAAVGDPLVELGSCDSAPLRELLPRMLKPSQNLHAQLLFWRAGLADAPPAGLTSEAAGARALQAFLARAGVDPDEARFEEGSGLSRHNVVTPRAIVKLLAYMSRHPHAAVFRDALPVAGVDGSIRNRMRGTPAEGNLRAKTGTLDMVYTLSGYVTPGGGEPLVFSLMLNQYTGATTERPGRAELDELAVLLAGAAAAQ
jgi:D-alanyl-D-alanine carboxypeptidase/D-alanyl-D-alanine-endopeptidase (penicillin-binding protein 4)